MQLLKEESCSEVFIGNDRLRDNNGKLILFLGFVQPDPSLLLVIVSFQ